MSEEATPTLDEVPAEPKRLTRNQRLQRKSVRLHEMLKQQKADHDAEMDEIEDFACELLVIVDLLAKSVDPRLLASINQKRIDLGFEIPPTEGTQN